MTIDMFLDPEDDPRVDPPFVGDERATLVGFLRWYRESLALKCSGLDAEQMARRAVEPSSMSLLGLIRHMAEVERSWFRCIMAGEEPVSHFPQTSDDPAFDDAVADPAVIEHAWEVWRAEVSNAERLVDEAPSLDVTGSERWHEKVTLRWVLVHMIEEYARHVGHADLLRERIDGRVGQ
jgi:uncharacterized damage-inducible protein DinB